MRRLVHIITPGDHYSPRTGSAIPTVVHGLSSFAPAGRPCPAVVVARGTYPDRYDSADVIEYDQASSLHLGPRLAERHLDGALSILGVPRLAARRKFAPTVGHQVDWEPSVILAHNAPQLIPLVDADQHAPVLYAHNQLFATYRQGETKRVLSRAAAIICVSQSLADQTDRRLHPRARRLIHVVRNGVDAGAFARVTPLRRAGPLKVVFVGRMTHQKGADVLVEAVRRLHRDDIHLTLIGSSGFDPAATLTSYERSVREAAVTLGERVIVSPFVSRPGVIQALQEADVVVIPSRWLDPCPLTVLEGMAAGAAVVGSDIGGIPESLSDAGLLVRPDDSGDLAQALEALVTSETLLHRTAAACTQYAREHDWSWASTQLHAALTQWN